MSAPSPSAPSTPRPPAPPRRPATAIPPIHFPESLPVSGRRDEITQAIRDHQVVIVCGETGSGKTTQLPKIALAMGRGRGAGGTGLIGHTQPRRIAASSVAKRIAEELNSPLGEVVGYKGPVQRSVPARCLGQAEDRRHPAGRDAERSACCAPTTR